MEKLSRIIVAVDISETDMEDAPDERTRLALDRAMWLARQAKAELRLVGVKFLGVGIQPAWRHEAGPEERPVVNRMIEQLEGLAARPRSAGIATSVETRVGEVAEQLLEAVEMWNADLLVVGGARRKGAVGLLGNTSFEVFRKAPCSVWIARTSLDDDLHEALVALDASDQPHGVLEGATHFARTVGSRLNVLSVVEDADAVELAQESLKECVEPYASQVELGAVEVLVGQPGEVILEQAERYHVATVFIGPTRRSALSTFFGSGPTGAGLKQLECSLVCARPSD